MQRILIFLAITSLFFTACKTDENSFGEFNLKMTATFDDAPLVNIDETYTYADGTPIKFQLFNYYLTDIRLVKENGTNADDHLLSEVELIEYSEFYTLQEAKEGVKLNFKDIPDGLYSGLRMGIGLSPDLNGTQPGDYAAGHALASNYWSWALGYVFLKIEGNADLNKDGEFNDNITYHVGQTGLYQILEFDHPIQIENGKAQTVNINVDVLDIMQNGNDFVDISIPENQQDHTNDEVLFHFLWENLVNSTKVQ